jgi:glycosyltransferase involved in cell wall biosynthesis
MRILWVPHAPLRKGRSRAEHLAERLSINHEVSVLSFHAFERREAWRYIWQIFTHRTRHNGGQREVAMWRLPKFQRLNSLILNKVLHFELLHHCYDVIIVPPASYMFGYPDFERLRRNTSVICDYLDGGDWSTPSDAREYERLFVRSADAVFCVSHGLVEQATTLNKNAYYVPNGVDLAKYEKYRAEHAVAELKRAVGLNPAAFVVSIIGMTCSSRLYFLDAIAALVNKGRNISLLLVGETPLRRAIEVRCGGIELDVKIIGPVPYASVLPYFLATDLGLYAVDDLPYYHNASPFKIFEYGAMGKPVLVAPRLDETASLRLPFVRFCEADASSLAAAVEKIMDAVPIEVSQLPLLRYDWGTIAATVENLIEQVVAKRRVRKVAASDGLSEIGAQAVE